ncbi:RidA family protein [Wukongibacter baidiensis]|uniref:RidA family protein n=1 Tax=Wukongibacter baidiensis TaxID=1723361 RepID=UPI003D7FA9A1
MNIEKRLKELNIRLPECPKPAAIYVPVVLSDKFIFVSGQTPKDGSTLLYKGKLGRDLTVEEGYEASRICALRCISALKSEAGDLDNIEGIVKLTGYVNSSDDFYNQSQVINGASELIEKIFGYKGKHARVAVGVNTLPGNAAVEIEVIAKVKELTA